jgi:hypothetical protein
MTHCCDEYRAYFRGVTDTGCGTSAEEKDLPAVPSVTRLALVTDAWHPQTNGVVNTLSRLAFRCSGEAARITARRYTWRASHDLFRSYLVPMGVPID